jgi:hypothetical protein
MYNNIRFHETVIRILCSLEIIEELNSGKCVIVGKHFIPTMSYGI